LPSAACGLRCGFCKARGCRLLTQEYVADGKFEPVIEKLLAQPATDYLQINSTTAGCFTFRIERASAQ